MSTKLLYRGRCSGGECHGRFGGDDSFFLPGVGGNTRSGGSSGKSTNGRAFSTSGKRADQRARTGASANFRDISLGVTFTLGAVSRRGNRNHLAIHLNRG